MSLDPHGGNIYAYDGVKLDFSVNLNPLGMPEEILQAVRDHGLEYDRYPDPNCRALRRALAAGRACRRNGWSLAMGQRISLCAWPWR